MYLFEIIDVIAQYSGRNCSAPHLLNHTGILVLLEKIFLFYSPFPNASGKSLNLFLESVSECLPDRNLCFRLADQYLGLRG